MVIRFLSFPFSLSLTDVPRFCTLIVYSYEHTTRFFSLLIRLSLSLFSLLPPFSFGYLLVHVSQWGRLINKERKKTFATTHKRRLAFVSIRHAVYFLRAELMMRFTISLGRLGLADLAARTADFPRHKPTDEDDYNARLRRGHRQLWSVSQLTSREKRVYGGWEASMRTMKTDHQDRKFADSMELISHWDDMSDGSEFILIGAVEIDLILSLRCQENCVALLVLIQISRRWSPEKGRES